DHDALGADREVLAVLLGVIADLHAGGDVHVLVDDRAADARAAADLHAFVEDALLHVGVGVDAHVGRDHAAVHAAAGDDAAFRDQRVGGASDTLVLFVREDELGGRGGVRGGGVDGPAGVVERELGIHRRQVHVALVV